MIKINYTSKQFLNIIKNNREFFEKKNLTENDADNVIYLYLCICEKNDIEPLFDNYRLFQAHALELFNTYIKK